VKPGTCFVSLVPGTETSDFDGVVGDGRGVAGVNTLAVGVSGTATTEVSVGAA